MLILQRGNMLSFEEAKARLETAGQSHVLQFWAELSAEESNALLEEISQLKPEELLEHCRAAAEAGSRHSSADGRLDARMEPVPPEFIGSVRKSDKETLQIWGDEGTAPMFKIIYNKICINFYVGKSNIAYIEDYIKDFCFQGYCRFHRTKWLFCC